MNDRTAFFFIVTDIQFIESASAADLSWVSGRFTFLTDFNTQKADYLGFI